MLEALIALAALAGNTVVAAASTDAWEACRRGFVSLLGRGDAKKTELAEQRLTETRKQLATPADTDLELVRVTQEAQWTTRLTDLLEEDPGVEAELRSLVSKIRAQLPTGVVSAADHSFSAGRDVNISASQGGLAVGVIHGNVTPGPYPPGHGGVAESGLSGSFAPGSAVASHWGIAIGQVLQPPRPEVAAFPVSLPPRPPVLAGREELLADLDSRLTAGDGPWPRVVALHGLGGAGKTSIAVEYAHRHLVEVGLAWQFPAEDPELLVAEFSRLAAQLGARELVDARDPVASVHAVLALFAVGWLLVFDNAADQASVQRWLPPTGNGRVLITSQSAVWQPSQALAVPVLGTDVAAEFLVSRTGASDRQAATALANELGGLPLALEQAAAYIETTGAKLAGYLSLFRDRRADLLARGEAAGHPANVAATLGLALSRLEIEAPAAKGLLRLLACLAPEPVPLTLLLSDAQAAERLDPDVAAVLRPLLGDSVGVGDAVISLRRYSLITPAGDGLVLMHRLVQAIALGQVPAGQRHQWEQAAASLVKAAIPFDTDQPETWPVCEVLLPHVRSVVDLTNDGMFQIAQYLGWSGSYPAALDLHQLMVAAYDEDEAYGPEHPGTLNARAGLAHWTGEAGDAAGARDLYAALLPIRERVSGPEHDDTLTDLANLALWTGEAGDAAGARDLYAALLPTRERVSGPDDPETLNVRAGFAHWTGEAGDAAGARDLYAALLPTRERVLGPLHTDTLTSRANLAYYAGEAGDAAGARDLYAALSPLWGRACGPEHPTTLTSRANLARFTGEAGDAAGARDLYAALLPIREQVSGPEHLATLKNRANLAHWTGEAGDAAGARDLYAALLPMRERVSGPEHPDTLKNRANVAYWAEKAAGG